MSVAADGPVARAGVDSPGQAFEAAVASSTDG
jgi:hypothetical protein